MLVTETYNVLINPRHKNARIPRALADFIRPSGLFKTKIEIRDSGVCNANSERSDFHDYSQQAI